MTHDLLLFIYSCAALLLVFVYLLTLQAPSKIYAGRSISFSLKISLDISDIADDLHEMLRHFLLKMIFIIFMCRPLQL